MTDRLLKSPVRQRKSEGATWCGAQTRALSFPYLRILSAPLVPLLEISFALLCAAGLVCRCEGGAKCRESLLDDSGHLFCAISGGRPGCRGTFSFLILVAGGQLDVGVRVVVHADRLGQRYVAGLRRLAKCMMPTLPPLYSHFYLPNSSDSRHSLLSSTCLPHALCTCVRTCLVRVWLLALCLAG